MRSRWWRHRKDLKLGVHHNIHLQRAWTKYGAESFEFTVLGYCLPEELLVKEQALLDETPSSDTYNIATLARGGTRLGQRNTPEHNAAIGRANKGNTSWNKGGENTWSEKATRSRVARYKHQVVAEHSDGRVLKFTHVTPAAQELGLGRTSVKNILNGYSQRTRSGWTFRYEPK